MSGEDVAMLEPKRRGLWFKLLIAFCVVVLIVAGWLFLERIRGQAALRKYEKELIAKGEKLMFAEVLPPLPDGPNKAIELVGLCSSFQTGVVMTIHAPQPMKGVAPGKALVITKEAEWFGRSERTERRLTWEQVGEDLERNRDVLNELRALVRAPVLRYPLNYRGVNTLLPHLARQKSAAQWLSGSALYKIRANDIGGAIDDIETIVMLARLTEEEPFLISQLVRIAVVQIAIQNCWPVLQHDGSDADFMRLEKIFAEIDMIGPFVLGLRGERAMARDTVAMIRSGQINIDDVIDTAAMFRDDDEAPSALDKVPYGDEMKGALRAHVIYPTWRYVFSYEDELHVIEEMQSLIDATATAKSQKSAAALRAYEAKAKEKGKPGGDFSSWRYFVTGLIVPGIERAGSRAFRAETHCEVIIAATALKRYHMRHKRYPSKLDELVPEFVPRMPVDWMDGKPLRYRLDGDQFVLWSVGPNGKDDGGAPKSEPTFSWMLGPDDVWPWPGSEADGAAFRESQRKR